MRVVVVPTPPRTKCGAVSYVRCDTGVQYVKEIPGSILVLAGDGTEDFSDLRRFKERARILGLSSSQIRLARNGMCRRQKHTIGDAIAAAKVLAGLGEHVRVSEVVSVTCWYHTRWHVHLFRQLRKAGVLGRFTVTPVISERYWPPNGLRNELRGTVDAMCGRPQRNRGGHHGKPVHDNAGP